VLFCAETVVETIVSAVFVLSFVRVSSVVFSSVFVAEIPSIFSQILAFLVLDKPFRYMFDK
jgi:hypothetical protein